MSVSAYYNSESDSGNDPNENTYCIFLHVVEGIGFNISDGIGDIAEQRKSRILLMASLNGVKFEITGRTLSRETSTIFNSNCIWECELNDVKRMKTDSRPVKLECFFKSGRSANPFLKIIGSLLLPLRNVQIVNNLSRTTIKLHWHKLGALSPEWRVNKPEIYLVLLIVKKTLLNSGQLESFLGEHKQQCVVNTTATTLTSAKTGKTCCNIMSPYSAETSLMLQSQNNVYVELLEKVGLIQVGNNSDIDCDVFNVSLTLKQLNHVAKLLELEHTGGIQRVTNKVLTFQYDFLGSNSHVHLDIQSNDSYSINERISLTFKSSLSSLRQYFQRIFYIPIVLYYYNVAIANYCFDFTKLLPSDTYFNAHKQWVKNDTFNFDRLNKILSPRVNKPSVDFVFSMELVTVFGEKSNCNMLSVSKRFGLHKNDNVMLASSRSLWQSNCEEQTLKTHSSLIPPSSSDFKILRNEMQISGVDKNDENNPYLSSLKDKMIVINKCSDKDEVIYDHLQCVDSGESNQNLNIKCNSVKDPSQVKTTLISVHVQTEAKPEKSDKAVAVITEFMKEVDQMELSYKVVRELEEWKCQQMEVFLRNLSQKEKNYMQELDNRWETQRRMLQARLDAKITRCEQLNAQLEKAQIDLKNSATQTRVNINLADKIKRDIENSYIEKFQKLEIEMQHLKMDLQEHSSIFESKVKEMEKEHVRLEMEKAVLKANIEKLEKQLSYTQESRLSADQLKELLTDLRKQSDRVVALETSRNYYKDKWSKASCEINKMKLACLKLQDKDMKENNTNEIKFQEFDLCIEKILSEEQKDLDHDKQNSAQIKKYVFNISDVSSSSGDEGVFSNILSH